MKLIKAISITTAVLFILAASAAFATSTAFQGYETNADGWTTDGSITRVASGNGTLGVNSASGQYHAEITNVRNGYDTGYGDAGYSFFGLNDTNYTGNFFQSIDVYIDANWAQPTYAGTPGFWIDMSPRHPVDNYGAEHNFRLTALGNSVNVSVDGQAAPLVSLANSGWYTFEMTFKKGAAADSLVTTDMNIYDANRTLLGTTTVQSTSPGGPLVSSQLGGNGYVWISVWQNGFANDVLAIDNVKTGSVPEPSTLVAVLSLIAPAGFMFRRKRA